MPINWLIFISSLWFNNVNAAVVIWFYLNKGERNIRLVSLLQLIINIKYFIRIRIWVRIFSFCICRLIQFVDLLKNFFSRTILCQLELLDVCVLILDCLLNSFFLITNNKILFSVSFCNKFCNKYTFNKETLLFLFVRFSAKFLINIF